MNGSILRGVVETSTTAVVRRPHASVPAVPEPAALPLLPWRDPHTVSAEELSTQIQRLEQACLEQPCSASLRTVLGMAYAVNYDVYKSMDTLEAARTLAPEHFWAQFKYAELLYRLRALQRAETEALRAVELAENAWQYSMARKQLQEIRSLSRQSIRNVAWTKPLTVPALVLSTMMLLVAVVMLWK